jgi:hypothetical protein
LVIVICDMLFSNLNYELIRLPQNGHAGGLIFHSEVVKYQDEASQSGVA